MSREAIINAKQEEVNALTQRMKDAKAIVVAEYRGLTVQKTEELRKALRKEGCELIVAKNNIAKRAATLCGFGAIDNDMTGPNGVVIGKKDSVAPAKILHEFARKNPKLIVKSGVIEGSFYNAAQVKAVSTLPSKQVLLAMLASQLYAPLKELAVGLDMITTPKSN